MDGVRRRATSQNYWLWFFGLVAATALLAVACLFVFAAAGFAMMGDCAPGNARCEELTRRAIATSEGFVPWYLGSAAVVALSSLVATIGGRKAAALFAVVVVAAIAVTSLTVHPFWAAAFLPMLGLALIRYRWERTSRRSVVGASSRYTAAR